MSQPVVSRSAQAASTAGISMTSVVTIKISVDAAARYDHPIVGQFYGELLEGNEYQEAMPSWEHKKLKVQYLRRLALTSLTAVEEGQTISFSIDGRPEKLFRLWSPKHLVAVNCEREHDRIARTKQHTDKAQFGREVDWKEYLRKSGLPTWFFSFEHLNMRVDHDEAKKLGITEQEIAKYLYLPARPSKSDQVVQQPDLNSFRILQKEKESVEEAVARLARSGFVVDPRQKFGGGGEYFWLNRDSQRQALKEGWSTPLDVLSHLHKLSQDVQPPRIVWRTYQYETYLNPPTRPTQLGHWEFWTQFDEFRAARMVGGPGNPWNLPVQPTASAVWKLKQHCEKNNLVNVTQYINLVWVPRLAFNVQPNEFGTFTKPVINGVQRKIQADQARVIRKQHEDAKATIEAYHRKQQGLESESEEEEHIMPSTGEKVVVKKRRTGPREMMAKRKGGSKKGMARGLVVRHPVKIKINVKVDKSMVDEENGEEAPVPSAMTYIDGLAVVKVDRSMIEAEDEEEAPVPGGMVIGEDLAAELERWSEQKKMVAEETAVVSTEGGLKRAASADEKTPSPSKRVRFSVE